MQSNKDKIKPAHRETKLDSCKLITDFYNGHLVITDILVSPEKSERESSFSFYWVPWNQNWPITYDTDSPMNQSKLKENKRTVADAQPTKNAGKRNTTTFTFYKKLYTKTYLLLRFLCQR